MLVAEDGDFAPAVPVEHAEQGLVFIVIEFSIRYVCVFLWKKIKWGQISGGRRQGWRKYG